MEWYYWSKPKIHEYQQQMHAIWRDKSMFNITKQIKSDRKEAMANEIGT